MMAGPTTMLGADVPAPHGACADCGQVRTGTPDRAKLYVRGARLVWLCRLCADDGSLDALDPR